MCLFFRHIGKIFLITIAMFLMAVQANAQAYNFNYITIQEGLPQSQAFAIAFDEDMHAWIGTQGGGLCRYDGADYQYITKNDSLISNRIYSIKPIKGSIWVGQKGGASLLSMSGKVRENYRLENSAAIITDIIFHNEEYLFASDNGVYCLKENKLVLVEDNPNVRSANIQSFFYDQNQNLWLCTNEGLLDFQDPFKRLKRGPEKKELHVESAVVYNEEVVVGTYESGIYFYDGELRREPALEQLNDKIILSLFVSGQNELWIGTMNNGVYVYSPDDPELKNFRSSNGLSGNHVKTIVSDYWENVWIGTSGGGVSVFQNSPFIEYNSSSGLNGNYVFSVLNDSRNNLWLGTEGTGVMRINDTSRVLFDEEYGFYSEKVKSIYEDRDGGIWFGTEGKGLGFYDSNYEKDTVFSFFGSNGMTGNWVKSFAENESTRELYIGTLDRGIFSIRKGKSFPFEANYKKLTASVGTIPSEISALSFYNGKLWFANRSGQYGYYQNGKCQVYSENGRSFRNITVHNNTVWVGSKDNGILKLEITESDSLSKKEWLTAGGENNIQSNNIYQLIYHQDQLWVGTEKGLDRLNLDSLNNISEAEHFGFQEGFEGVETNINAGSVDINGNLWFGTVDGLFVYKGRDVNRSQRKPPVLRLNDFQIIFESIEQTEYAGNFENGEIIKPLMLPYNQNHISFLFKAVHFSYSDNIRYRWRLDGVDPDWTPGTKINVATYPNLLPGEYTFQVQASIDDAWEQEPIVLQFSIDQPYWEKLWFKATYYAAIGLILIIIILIITVRVRRKNRALNEKLKLEKNLLELEQKALRLQMNPHFIFNVLNSIHNLIILNDSGKARYALSKFSKLMRQVLENSREKFISIDDEIETLQNYIQLERLTANVDIDLEFDIDGDLDTTEEILPPLMIQPFVENSVIHGLKGLEEKGRIDVTFRWYENDVLECSISDNGIGRKKASQINAQKEVYHKSTALQVTQERLANLNTVNSFVPFEIVDLKKSDGTAAGTKVIIRIMV